LPLETAQFISDLTTSNPAHTDGLAQADSHLRLIKATVKATFPNFTAVALQSTQAQLDAAAAQSAGTAVSTIPLGTAALPGLTPVGNPNTGLWSPAANQLAISLNGAQALLMGGTALVTSLGLTAAAYAGGTGQLVPLGAALIWHDDTLPTEGGYCWANGQIIASANTVCPILLARWGNKFGGNGTTTMGVPDYRDTVPVGKSTMGGVAARGLQTLGNTVIGSLIGLANTVLTTLNLPPYSPAGIIIGGTQLIPTTPTAVSNTSGGASVWASNPYGSSAFASQPGFQGTAQGGISQAVNNVQPSTTCNFIIRIG
jgi:microcystin-dependent protein